MEISISPETIEGLKVLLEVAVLGGVASVRKLVRDESAKSTQEISTQIETLGKRVGDLEEEVDDLREEFEEHVAESERVPTLKAVQERVRG